MLWAAIGARCRKAGSRGVKLVKNTGVYMVFKEAFDQSRFLGKTALDEACSAAYYTAYAFRIGRSVGGCSSVG